ncbi:DVU_1553 family AMP-dependent CoA ligase [Desulfosarcina cetonica]|uniref:DVU_1553 family AMP-dependent CoA ligase n=1 Tax=Desulfosarcina cetonica TaxID=90730 RepID=UPI0006D04FA6|nr:AMP-binding protein [Desulfosarcina cetonica]
MTEKGSTAHEAIQPTRLENWLKARLAPQPLSVANLQAFQLARLNHTLAHVRKNSPFYRERLKALPHRPLTDLSQTADLPLISADDLRQHHLEMLCVSHSRVTRVVTMQTSGTTAAPKRLYFSEADLERNIDFFHHGLTCMLAPGQTLLILLPSTSPDSAGDQLKRAAARIPAEGHVHWPVMDLEGLLEAIETRRVNCLVGAPAQIFALCRHAKDAGRLRPNPIQSVLLTTDYVPRSVVDEIREQWNCRVFEHYGMSEMGLGGALECDVHEGYHLREADLLVEVVDPVSGTPLPPGVEGRWSLPRWPARPCP